MSATLIYVSNIKHCKVLECSFLKRRRLIMCLFHGAVGSVSMYTTDFEIIVKITPALVWCYAELSI